MFLETTCTQAAIDGNTDLVKVYIADKDVNLNYAEKPGGTPLYWAARKGHVAVVDHLLKRDPGQGLNLNVRDNKGKTPVMSSKYIIY